MARNYLGIPQTETWPKTGHADDWGLLWLGLVVAQGLLPGLGVTWFMLGCSPMFEAFSGLPTVLTQRARGLKKFDRGLRDWKFRAIDRTLKSSIEPFSSVHYEAPVNGNSGIEISIEIEHFDWDLKFRAEIEIFDRDLRWAKSRESYRRIAGES